MELAKGSSDGTNEGSGDATPHDGHRCNPDIHEEILGAIGRRFRPTKGAIRLLLIAAGGVLAVTMLVVSVSYLPLAERSPGVFRRLVKPCRVRQGDRSASLVGTAGTSLEAGSPLQWVVGHDCPARCQPGKVAQNHRR